VATSVAASVMDAAGCAAGVEVTDAAPGFSSGFALPQLAPSGRSAASTTQAELRER